MRIPHRLASHTTNYVSSLIVLCFAGALILTACDSSAPRVTYAPTATPTVTPHPTVQPASTEGWAVYTDTRFHFQIPIPPGWKAKAYTTAYACPQGGDGAYIVGFFPPDVGVSQDYPFGKIHEIIDIYLPLCSFGEEATPDPHWTPEPNGILIDGVQARYVVADFSDWMQRWAAAPFGGHQYIFALDVTPQEKGQADLPLFFGMLAGFKYLG